MYKKNPFFLENVFLFIIFANVNVYIIQRNLPGQRPIFILERHYTL